MFFFLLLAGKYLFKVRNILAAAYINKIIIIVCQQQSRAVFRALEQTSSSTCISRIIRQVCGINYDEI